MKREKYYVCPVCGRETLAVRCHIYGCFPPFAVFCPHCSESLTSKDERYK